MKKKPSARENSSSSSSTAAREEESEWEMRPGGMLVQKRTANTDAAVTRNLRLRIAYGALRYEICVSSIATFGKTSSGSKVPLLIFFCSVWLLRKLLVWWVMLVKLSQVAVSVQHYESSLQMLRAHVTWHELSQFFIYFKNLIKMQKKDISFYTRLTILSYIILWYENPL